MKTFQTSRLIGILCILFGAEHLLIGTVMAFMSGVHPASTTSSSDVISNASSWMEIWSYAGLLVNLVYLWQVSFFYRKNPFHCA